MYLFPILSFAKCLPVWMSSHLQTSFPKLPKPACFKNMPHLQSVLLFLLDSQTAGVSFSLLLFIRPLSHLSSFISSLLERVFSHFTFKPGNVLHISSVGLLATLVANIKPISFPFLATQTSWKNLFLPQRKLLFNEKILFQYN